MSHDPTEAATLVALITPFFDACRTAPENLAKTSEVSTRNDGVGAIAFVFSRRNRIVRNGPCQNS
jgi:hypothetical protein